MAARRNGELGPRLPPAVVAGPSSVEASEHGVGYASNQDAVARTKARGEIAIRTSSLWRARETKDGIDAYGPHDVAPQMTAGKGGQFGGKGSDDDDDMEGSTGNTRFVTAMARNRAELKGGRTPHANMRDTTNDGLATIALNRDIDISGRLSTRPGGLSRGRETFSGIHAADYAAQTGTTTNANDGKGKGKEFGLHFSGRFECLSFSGFEGRNLNVSGFDGNLSVSSAAAASSASVSADAAAAATAASRAAAPVQETPDGKEEWMLVEDSSFR
jgi:hypothetical protein